MWCWRSGWVRCFQSKSAINTDISILTPINMTLREIPESELPADFTISWSEMVIIDGVLTHNHHVKTEREKQRLLSEAKNKITVLQYAVDLGIATEDELAQLDKWKEYVVMETRANT
ncbi:TPA: tail fiber assembly protein [Morganella morganii]|nr:tail fiber assembly protein [Morganella morganii]